MRHIKLIIFIAVAIILVPISCNKNVEPETVVKESAVRKNSAAFKKLLFETSEKIRKAKSNRIRTKSSYDGFDSDSELTEEYAKEVLHPLLESSKSLLNSYGINLSEYFSTDEDPNIIIWGLFTIFWEEENINPTVTSGETEFSNVAYCALIAIGIGDVLYNVLKTSLSVTAATKAFAKVASRYLGWIGVALAVYQFGDCLINGSGSDAVDVDVPESEQDIPESEQDISESEQDIPESEQDIPESEQDIPESEQDISESELGILYL